MHYKVIHNSNVDNDVKMSLHQSLLGDSLAMFGIPEVVLDNSICNKVLFAFRFASQFIRRLKKQNNL